MNRSDAADPTGSGDPTAEPGVDLIWFFGYGSLIWRPDFPYRERHAALLSGWHRAFCRYSFRHRGTPQRPGLVIGLREGGQCPGVAFGVTPHDLPAVLAYLDEREGGGYRRHRVSVRLVNLGGVLGDGPAIPAWVYIPDPAHPSYFGEEAPQRLVELVASGRGESGTALDYLRDLIAHLAPMGVREPGLEAVLAAAERLG